ncbi:MAG TPA: NAD(P)-binding domain-containing protein [Terriglobales bacterium]|jgi:pyrroline-5-carboxylate reductase|nr:NAD(P)-binding domain-containing protein [Terriglobales bacterium]
MTATVFLGGGRITSALVAGLRLAGYARPIVVHDRHPRKLQQLKRQYGVTAEPDLQRAVAQAGLLVVAVRPDSVGALLQQVGQLRRSLPAVSLAAGIPLSRLHARLGPAVHWARAMPSPVCRTARGLTAVTFDRGFPAASKRMVRRLFARLGQVIEIPESRFDAFTVTYSSSHGYHALAALAGAAQRLGLDRRSALTAAAHALGDGVVTWREGKIPLHRLLHEAATPGGVAATVMSAMDEAGYGRIVERALRKGIAHARRMT